VRVKSKREIERRGRDLEGEMRERGGVRQREMLGDGERETRSSGGSTPEDAISGGSSSDFR
jgi:hypothetical protein